jgi:HEPN domain-containing protein
MTPADWLLDETRQWVQRAEADLRAASEALFHCQQAAEKYLKAFLN